MHAAADGGTRGCMLCRWERSSPNHALGRFPLTLQLGACRLQQVSSSPKLHKGKGGRAGGSLHVNGQDLAILRVGEGQTGAACALCRRRGCRHPGRATFVLRGAAWLRAKGKGAPLKRWRRGARACGLALLNRSSTSRSRMSSGRLPAAQVRRQRQLPPGAVQGTAPSRSVGGTGSRSRQEVPGQARFHCHGPSSRQPTSCSPAAVPGPAKHRPSSEHCPLHAGCAPRAPQPSSPQALQASALPLPPAHAPT